MAQQRIHIDLSIPEELKARAKAKAALERRTLSAVVEAFLEEWVAGKLETPTRSEKQKKLVLQVL
jgi:hypothetical protein